MSSVVARNWQSWPFPPAPIEPPAPSPAYGFSTVDYVVVLASAQPIQMWLCHQSAEGGNVQRVEATPRQSHVPWARREFQVRATWATPFWAWLEAGDYLGNVVELTERFLVEEVPEPVKHEPVMTSLPRPVRGKGRHRR